MSKKEEMVKVTAVRNTVYKGESVAIGDDLEVSASDARLMRNKIAMQGTGEAKAAKAAAKALAAAE